ncbi:hypothetical protein Cyrtocomes_00594 [Candidatus Cyrtobacter comes]|uniref:Uncharacterized protein n=1 Tax=Candidatus Cyrtobacter comes TaxID=675776 RepID=A0ABU5L7W6_9RICK|nr:hypothetical protein [Candidatus Cyrtobacter comes]MDZ5762221.1 hypothetical protein [Candidatus Cyrtobacter comes]
MAREDQKEIQVQMNNLVAHGEHDAANAGNNHNDRDYNIDGGNHMNDGNHIYGDELYALAYQIHYDERYAYDIQMREVKKDSRHEQRVLKRAELKAKKEALFFAETSKTGIYVIENSDTIIRVLNDSYEWGKGFSERLDQHFSKNLGNHSTQHFSTDNKEKSTPLIDANGGYLHAGLSFLHLGFSSAYAYYSKSINTIAFSAINTVIYAAKSNTDLLKSDNPYIQCFMDASTAPIAQLVTFNPYGAAVTAGLGSAKCVLPESLQPVIAVAQNINDLANALINTVNPVIQTVEAVKLVYTTFDALDALHNHHASPGEASTNNDVHI